MEWEVLYDEEFAAWLRDQARDVRVAIVACVPLLQSRGPHLGRPHVDTIKGSTYSNMKELRVRSLKAPWRVLFAFDPSRSAILLAGGCKAGDRRWYEKVLPIAEERFRRHLERLERMTDGDQSR